MSRHRALCASMVVALAAGLGSAVAAPARAEASGPLTIQVEGRLGLPALSTPLVTFWRLPVNLSLTGVVALATETNATLVAFEPGETERPFALGALWSTEVPAAEGRGLAKFECAVTEGTCLATGALVGRGSLVGGPPAPSTGSRIFWEISFPQVRCQECLR